MDSPSSFVEEENYFLGIHDSVSAEFHDLATGVKFVSTPKCGAVFTFTGVVRDTDTRSGDESKLEPIKGIYYEGYQKMIEKEVESLIRFAISEGRIIHKSDETIYVRDPECRCWVSLCVNCFVPAGKSHIMICLSSQKRDFGNHTVMKLLEQIKIYAPIWKKIVFADDHEEWVQPKDAPQLY